MSLCRSLMLNEFSLDKPLTLQPTSIPLLDTSQVLVDIHFSGINPIDVKTRMGLGWAAEQKANQLPWALGYDAAGTVVDVAEGVAQQWVGKRVCGMLGFPLVAGCYQSMRATSLDELVELPDEVTLQQAAALPVAGLTAWQAVHQYGQAKSGETVLVVGASGAVGQLACQIALLAGCNVIALCSVQGAESLKSLALLQTLNYASPWLSELQTPVDLLLDCAGGQGGLAAIAGLKPQGRLVTIPTVSAAEIIQQAQTQKLNACGMLVQPDTQVLAELLQLVAKKKISIPLQDCYPPESIDQAHQRQNQGHVHGKLLIDWQL